jgi:hypothetical protein
LEKECLEKVELTCDVRISRDTGLFLCPFPFCVLKQAVGVDDQSPKKENDSKKPKDERKKQRERG